MISTLQNQYQKLQDRIDAMYVDKLEGRISEAFFTRKSEEWGSEQGDVLRKIEQHHSANRSYFEEGTRLLELAQEAVTLYEQEDSEEKRILLNSVFSRSTWKNGKLIPAYRTPFDLLALTNTAYQKEKAGSSIKDGLFEIWLPGLVSQGVLLWDGMRLAMERVIKGHTKITVRGSLPPTESWYDVVPVRA